MHETERDLAARQVENAQITDSYVIGDIDETAFRNSSVPAWSSTRWHRQADTRPMRWRRSDGFSLVADGK
jgi:hypothetical protein